MVRVEVMAVGRELLIGRTLNTNAHWIGRRLALMGSAIARMSTVDDELGEISSGLKEAMSRHPDVIVVMGGLGPTPDDMTLAGVAEGLGRRVKLNRAALGLIRAHYSRTGVPDTKMTPARRKMALLPEGATALVNEVGTAPGVRLEERKTTIFCLPGVPGEMRSIFSESVERDIRRRIGRLHRVAIRLCIDGVYESVLAPTIAQELGKNPGAYIKSHPRGLKEGRSRIELDIVMVGKNKGIAAQTASAIADDFAKSVKRLGGASKTVVGKRFAEEG